MSRLLSASISAALILSLPGAASAAFEELELGVSDQAMGSTGVLGSGPGSAFFNPASVAGSEGTVASAAGRLPFTLADLKTAGADVSIPVSGSWRASAGARFFGFSDYSEQVGYATLAGRLTGEMSFGIQPVFARVSIGDGVSDYGSASAVSVNAGFQVEIYDRWQVAAAVRNPFESRIGESGERMQRRLDVGVGYQPSAGMTSRLALSRDYRGMRVLAGQSLPLGPLTLMAGVKSDPASITAGFAVLVSGVRFEYAVETHPALDPSHSAGASYAF
jgi:hypothetical protein